MRTPLHIDLRVTREEITACAKVLIADADGTGYDSADGVLRDDLLTRLVLRATVIHGLRNRHIKALTARTITAWNRRARNADFQSAVSQVSNLRPAKSTRSTRS